MRFFQFSVPTDRYTGKPLPLTRTDFRHRMAVHNRLHSSAERWERAWEAVIRKNFRSSSFPMSRALRRLSIARARTEHHLRLALENQRELGRIEAVPTLAA